MQYNFGFVIPDSVNTWEQMITAESGAVMTKEMLSGNLVCETLFREGDEIIASTKYRVYYD